MPCKFTGSKSEEVSQLAVAKRDEILSQTHEELSTWIDANIDNMRDVRDYLKRLSRIVRANKEGLKIMHTGKGKQCYLNEGLNEDSKKKKKKDSAKKKRKPER